MEELLPKVLPFLEDASMVLMVLVIIATIVAKFIKGEEDDEKVSKVAALIIKAIKWLPTIGVNPRTKKLEEAYKLLKEVGKAKDE